MTANYADISATSAGRTFKVHALLLSKIFESKVYALTTPHRQAIKAKQTKDLQDVSWIIQNAPQALANAPRVLDMGRRQYVVRLLIAERSPLVSDAQHLLQVVPVNVPVQTPFSPPTGKPISGDCNKASQVCVSIISSRCSVSDENHLLTGQPHRFSVVVWRLALIQSVLKTTILALCISILAVPRRRLL